MKTWNVLLGCSAALALAACSQEEAAPETDAMAPDGAESDAMAPSGVEAGEGDSAEDSVSLADQCRARAASEYGVTDADIASADEQTARVDGSVPVNGTLADGSSFQCNFDAAGAFTDFVKVESEPAAPVGPDLSATALDNFQGARAGQAEMGIQRLGYEIVRSEGLTNFWYNSQTQQCYSITTAQGRYAQVNPQDKSACTG